MIHEIRIPSLNPNDEELLVADLVVSEGERVEPGDELFVVESTKAAVSIDSEHAGFVRGLAVESGDYAPVGSIALYIADTIEEQLPGQREASPKQVKSEGSTAKSRLLAKKKKGGARPGRSGGTPSTSPEPTPSNELNWVREALDAVGELKQADGFPEYTSVEAARESESCLIEDGVVLSPGSRIKAKRLIVRSGARIGADTFIEGETVYIGGYANIGRNTSLVSVDIVLGDGAYVGHEVEVDLSGGRSRESRLLAGPASLISPRCYVNTAREVVLETESALSPGVSVFTHRFWQSVLDGYDALFAGVRLCERSWVGSGCQVLPGVIVGQGAVVMSGSTLVDCVPAESLYGGVPAKVIKDSARRRVSTEDQARILKGVLTEFSDILRFKGCSIETMPCGGLDVITPDSKRRRIVLLDTLDDAAEGSVVLNLGEAVLEKEGVYCFNIGAKSVSGIEDRLVHEVRNFLRRKGIRFHPYAWDADYRKGL